MEKLMNRGGGRSLRSALVKFLSVGACSALLAAGAIIVAASPAGAANATQLVFTTQPPAAVTVNTNVTAFRVTVEDGTGALATSNLTDQITITSNCGIGGTNPVAAIGGVATFNAFQFSAAGGPCTLTAADTGSGAGTVASTTSSAVTVYSTTAIKLGFSSEPAATVTAGSALTFTVQAQNGAGALATTGGQTDPVVIASSCTIAGTTTGTLVGGSLSFTAVTIDGGTPPCTLTASDTTGALIAGTSSAIAVIAGAATKVVFTTEPPATINEAAALTTFRVSVEDVYGNVVSSGTGATYTVTLTPSTGCTLGGSAAAVAVAGVATFSALTITTTGACTLTATDSSRTLTTAASTAVDSQGAQAALTVSSLKGYLGTPLVLTSSGGSGTGAVTFTAVPGTALGCVVTGTSLAVTSLGTCVVTATKAASLTNLASSSAATTVTFVLPFKATRTNGFVIPGRTSTITSHAGTTVVVARDTGKLLTVKVTVKAGSRNGTYTFTIKLGNGKTCKVKYVQRA
jgi:hypothetical protein